MEEAALHHSMAPSSNPRGRALPIFTSQGSLNTTMIVTNNNSARWELQGRVGGLLGLVCFALIAGLSTEAEHAGKAGAPDLGEVGREKSIRQYFKIYLPSPGGLEILMSFPA